jgi:F-type H+-transporting ATPase subunit a
MNIPLQAETLAHIGSFPITNAYVNSSILMLAIVAFAFFFRKRIAEVPGRLQTTVEAIVEALFGYFDQVTNDREKSKRFFPLVAGLFFFILGSNWLGLLPGTGSIGIHETVHGTVELVPILRSANSDLNLTLAMALVSVIASHLLGIVTLGFFTHANKFIQLGTLWKAIKTLQPMKILVALIEMVVGVIEVFSEIAKVLSLSLRLFGNIFAGEVLMTVISSLIAYVAPLPFMALELLVGIVQASVFAMLTLVYLTIQTSAPHGDEDEHAEHESHPRAEVAATA